MTLCLGCRASNAGAPDDGQGVAIAPDGGEAGSGDAPAMCPDDAAPACDRPPLTGDLTGDLAEVEQFCRTMVSLRVDRLAACFGGGTDFWSPRVGCGVCEELSEAVAAGLVRLDPAKAQECLAAIVASPCSILNELFSPQRTCGKALLGRLPEGNACQSRGFYTKCAPGTYCGESVGGPPVCTAYLGPGQTCQGGGCAEGLRCDCPEPTSVSQESCPGPRVCGVPPVKGLGEECAGEFRSYPCQPGLECVWRNNFSAICRVVEPGRPCTGPLDCRADEQCREGRCASNTAGPCRDDNGLRCAPGYACFGDRCGPARAIGETCTPGRSQCLAGSTCGGDGRCRARPELGERCERDGTERAECVRSFCLLDSPGASTGVCTAFRGPGETCGVDTQDADCGPFANCDFRWRRCVRTCF